ncbi:MAG: hypothetical protein ABIL69_08540 [candidate division WOR-3 bacterium]
MIYLFCISIFYVIQANSAKITDSTNICFHRDYQVLFATNYNLLNSTENSRTAVKFLNDIYFRTLKPKIRNSILKNSLGFVWRFTTTWITMSLPHEFGHYLRTKQAGGDFGIEKITFPMIYGRLKLPDTATPEDHTLALIGGFEANFITARDVQNDFFQYGSLYNEELAISFAHRIMYNLYAFLFTPVNPEDPGSWKEVIGDPITFTKLVWEFGGRSVFLQDSTINRELVDFYKKSIYSSLLWNLFDMNFYREASSFFGDELGGKKAKYLIGNEDKGWAYGTFFNTSVLGAELYLNNYLRFNKKFFVVYLKYGFPFVNNGAGIFTKSLIDVRNFKADFGMDIWNQYYYGNGFAFNSSLKYFISNQFIIMVQPYWKSKGYLLGMPTNQCASIILAVKYYFNKY